MLKRSGSPVAFRAFLGLAYVYFQMVNTGIAHEEVIEKAETSARQALELDPASGEAHLVLGLIHGALRGDPRTSFHHLRRALEQNPDDPHALMWLVVGHTLVGKTEEAGPLLRRALRVDPLAPATRYMPALVDLWGGRTSYSAEDLTLWFRLEPNPASLFFSGICQCYAGHTAACRELLEQHLQPQSPDIFTALGTLLQRSLQDRHDGPEVPLPSQLEVSARRDPQSSYFMADIHALAGRPEPALRWLNNAVQRGFCNHPFMVTHDPLLEGIRNEPEFERISDRVKEEWLSFDA